MFKVFVSGTSLDLADYLVRPSLGNGPQLCCELTSAWAVTGTDSERDDARFQG